MTVQTPGFDLNICFSEQLYELETLASVTIQDQTLFLYDPLQRETFPYLQPLDQTIPNGTYPLIVATRNDDTYGRYFVAAKLLFQEKTATTFSMACQKGQNRKTLSEGEFFSYPTASGFLALSDQMGLRAYQANYDHWKKEHSSEDFYEHFLKMKLTPENPQIQQAAFSFTETNKNDLLIVSSGIGNGNYPAFFGYDETNTCCCLIIPFLSPDFYITLWNHYYIEQLCHDGSTALEEKQYQLAIEQFQTALSLLDDAHAYGEAALWIYSSLGDAYFALQDYTRATRFFDTCTVCESGKENAFILYRLGECAYFLNDIKKATSYFLRSYQQDSEGLLVKQHPEYLVLIQPFLE